MAQHLRMPNRSSCTLAEVGSVSPQKQLAMHSDVFFESCYVVRCFLNFYYTEKSHQQTTKKFIATTVSKLSKSINQTMLHHKAQEFLGKAANENKAVEFRLDSSDSMVA